ncbi:MAG: DNA-3-methyladenine glycosylase [Phycisphaerales bacterium]
MPAALPRRFYTRDPVTLARALLGQRLVRVLEDGSRLAGIIVETEAYLGAEDMAAHTYGGRRTARNEAMYGPGGTAYVYFTYGMHHCFNVVGGCEGDPVAVLIRALEPVEGLERMRIHRAPERKSRRTRTESDRNRQRPAALAPPAHPLAAGSLRDLCRGPARLCRALAVDRALNAIDLTRDSRLFIERDSPGVPEQEIGVSPRIGVGYAAHWAEKPLRFFIRPRGRFVSGPARLNSPPPP